MQYFLIIRILACILPTPQAVWVAHERAQREMI